MSVAKKIDEQYVDTGRVKVVYRDLPLKSIHAQAVKAAEAARCAGDVGGKEGFWGMYDKLYENQKSWAGAEDAEDQFKQLAKDLDLDSGEFDACLDEGKNTEAVMNSYNTALELGLASTPTFVLGGGQIAGAYPFETFQDAFETVLQGGSLPTPTPMVTPEYVEVEAPQVEVEVGDAPVLGDPDAPITMIEFSDYQCPYCGAFVNQSFSMLKDEFIDTGRIRYAFKDLPLTSIHPDAVKAAEAAHCAREQGGDEAYFEMHDALFADQQKWSGGGSDATLFGPVADEVGLDGDTLVACVEDGTYTATVQAGFDEAAALGVNGTPSFVINGYLTAGAFPPDMLREMLDGLEDGKPISTWVLKEQAEMMEQQKGEAGQQEQQEQQDKP